MSAAEQIVGGITWIKRILIALIYRPLQFLILSSLLASVSFDAGSAEPFPGSSPDSRLINAQQKSDELFEDGQYGRAMTIYRDELAPVGDKFAQYMVGYMYLSARGVEEDLTLASAWYRLASERGHESFVRARDVVVQALNDEQRRRSDQLYADLRGELGDMAIITRLIETDLSRLRRHNEPLTGLNLASVNIDDPIRNDDTARRVAQQMEARMNYLTGLVDADENASDQERERINELRDDVTKMAKSVD